VAVNIAVGDEQVIVGVGATMLILGKVVLEVTATVAVDEHPLTGVASFNVYVPAVVIPSVEVIIPPGLHE
jgi:hypothetical protein